MDIKRYKDNPELLQELSPREFEELVAELIRNSGWDVSLTPQTRDGGYDIFATKKEVIGEITSIIEVKKYRKDRPVGIEVVRELYGVKNFLNVSQAILVTSSRFTASAKEFVNARYDISLADIDDIINLLKLYVPDVKNAKFKIDRNFFSCFISYSHKDKAFVQYLNDKLKERGIRVWYAPEDLKPGQKIHEEIDKAIHLFDKLLIVISENSMNSEWVKTEIRKARKREIKEGKRILFPISITDFDKIRKWELFDADSGKDLAVEMREYLIPDFSNWENETEFNKAFTKLVEGLENR